EESDQAALLKGIMTGKIHMLATDHAPHTLQQKHRGAFGVPGLEVYGGVAAFLLDHGMSPVALAKATSLHAAVRFSLGNKGRIAEGWQADFTILRMEERKVQPPYHTKCGWLPYDGMILPGWIPAVVRAGHVVLENGQFTH
ncbi:MAG: amidohydrolase family protein, partial [Candidatus Marinimicrobia bacterium]|nr:amidohydrolase family protein [Candidatus Neomarinimicrobiota bacterium]